MYKSIFTVKTFRGSFANFHVIIKYLGSAMCVHSGCALEHFRGVEKSQNWK